MIKAEFELWKDVEGFEGLYQVSTWGRVRSLDRYVNTMGNSKRLVKGKILKGSPDKDGYLIVHFRKDGKEFTFKKHRLVALAFISNPENKSQVNHIDENKTNNYVCNLNWMTCKENINHGTHNERCAKLNLIHEWLNAQEANDNGYCDTCIYDCCNGKQKYHRGCIWSYTKLN